jgi:hypothetical protein
VGEHVEDFVDAYFGPAALKQEVLAGAPHDPHSLRDEALALSEDAPGEGLEDDRVQWLLGQLRGIECVTARLAGEDITWADEVERCFRIRPLQVDEEFVRASHERLDDVLPGSSDLSSRYNAWLDAANVPRETLPHAIDILSGELRRRAAGIVDLPPDERVDYETVRGEVWEAFNSYRGDLCSVVEVNEDLPISLTSLIDIVAHEAYPGHHTERVCKESLLYRDKSRFETSVTIALSTGGRHHGRDRDQRSGGGTRGGRFRRTAGCGRSPMLPGRTGGGRGRARRGMAVVRGGHECRSHAA